MALVIPHRRITSPLPWAAFAHGVGLATLHIKHCCPHWSQLQRQHSTAGTRGRKIAKVWSAARSNKADGRPRTTGGPGKPQEWPHRYTDREDQGELNVPRPSPRDARHSSTADAWDKVAARLQDVDQTSTSGQDWLPEEPPSAPAPRRTHFGGHSREGHTPRRYPAHTDFPRQRRWAPANWQGSVTGNGYRGQDNGYRSTDSYRDNPGRGRSAPPGWGGARSDQDFRDSQAEPSLQHRLKGEALYGVAPIASAIAAGRRRLYTLYVQEGLRTSKRKDGGACHAAIDAARTMGVDIEEVPKHELNLACDNRPHQGLVLDCDPLRMEHLAALPPAPRRPGTRWPLWLALDEIMDPQNLGAILRSAHFLGATGVLCCAKNSAPLSPVVAKASAGALDAMAVHACASMPRALNTAAESGWMVLGADLHEDASDIATFTLTQPAVLVLGSEGRGLRPLVRQSCSQLVQIGPALTSGAGGLSEGVAIDSLNVSVAAGVMLHRLLNAQNGAGSSLQPAMDANGSHAVVTDQTELVGMARRELGAVV